MLDHSQGTAHKVAIVVDRNFGNKLVDLARQYHVWIVESSSNTPVIRDVWASEPSDPNADLLGPGVTSFEATDNETAQAMCARISGDVEDHHGEFGHEPPWSEIEIVGAPLDPYLEGVFLEMGASHFEATPDGFVCRR
jgi:hypothetical protein